MNKDIKSMLDAFGKAQRNRFSFLEEIATSRREFLRNSSLLAAGIAAGSAGGGLVLPRIAGAADWSLAEAAKPIKARRSESQILQAIRIMGSCAR